MSARSVTFRPAPRPPTLTLSHNEQKVDDIGSEERRKHFKPENGEPFPDQLRGFEFLPGHLRNPVQGVAEFDDSGQNVRKRLHSSQ